MLHDAHAHPFDLSQRFSGGEEERRRLGVVCAASSWNRAEFLAHEAMAHSAAVAGGPELLLCFGVHPQLPASDPAAVEDSCATLAELAAGGRIAAVGEAGFDLYGPDFKATEAQQEELFDRQLDIAVAASLPMVLHLRRGMHKIFARSRPLAKLPALALHSYSGTYREALDLVGRGVNAYFSFGTAILLNHRQAMNACARLPAERLLFETDAPYQPLRGKAYSSWGDLAEVIAKAAELRGVAGSPDSTIEDLTMESGRNFAHIFGSSKQEPFPRFPGPNQSDGQFSALYPTLIGAPATQLRK